MNRIRVDSTSKATAQANDVVLRETLTTRLIFRPLLVDNVHDQEASVKGEFIFQRKIQADSWEDHKDLNLTQLKASEWVKIELKSIELLHFYQSLSNLYEIYKQEGIPTGGREFIPADYGLGSLLATGDEELATLLNENPDNGSELLLRLLHWFAQIGLSEQVVQQLENLELANLQELTALAGLTTLKACYRIWEENEGNSEEEFWQKTFSNYSFILSQVFAHPVVIAEEKAYVGGKNIGNVGGNIVDFLSQNDISKNAVLVEIKTPQTKLLGSRYRKNTYEISGQLSGGIVQVSNYKHSLVSEFASLQRDRPYELESFEPLCVVIAGNYRTQIDDPDKRRSFELFRSHLQGVQIITYDELFGKVRFFIDLLEGVLEQEMNASVEEDDLPF